MEWNGEFQCLRRNNYTKQCESRFTNKKKRKNQMVFRLMILAFFYFRKNFYQFFENFFVWFSFLPI